MNPEAALARRHPELIAALLAALVEADGWVGWDYLIAEHSADGRWSWRTVDNTLRELAAFGAIERSRRAHGDTGNVRLTTLGRHWIRQTAPQLPAHRR